SHSLLDHDEPPEFAREEVVGVGRRPSQEGFPCDTREALERVLANVYERGHVGHQLRPGPALRLLEELELHVIESRGAKLRAGEVPQFVPLRRFLPFEQSQLVVTVQVVLVVAVAKLYTLQELVGDLGVAGGGTQSGEPIEAGEKPVLYRTRLDVSRPTGDA